MFIGASFPLSSNDIEVFLSFKSLNRQSKYDCITSAIFSLLSFGENQIQEIESKWPTIRENYPDVNLNFIGSIQSRKVKKICELCDVIHSIDREKIVKLISELKSQGMNIPKLFLQVNIGLESQKSGINPNDVKDFIEISLKK